MVRKAWIPLTEINPFDRTHWSTVEGFEAKEKRPGEHLEGAQHVRQIIAGSVHLRPIAVCPSDKAPADIRDPSKPWQRLDGFKRYWGLRLAGARVALCEIHDDYKPGCQHGLSLTIGEKEMGKILMQLASGTQPAAALPYAERVSIEDCETVHLHLGNMRLEYTPEQFIRLAGYVAEAAAALRARRGLK